MNLIENLIREISELELKQSHENIEKVTQQYMSDEMVSFNFRPHLRMVAFDQE